MRREARWAHEQNRVELWRLVIAAPLCSPAAPPTGRWPYSRRARSPASISARPIARGQIAIEPSDPADAQQPRVQPARACRRARARRGSAGRSTPRNGRAGAGRAASRIDQGSARGAEPAVRRQHRRRRRQRRLYGGGVGVGVGVDIPIGGNVRPDRRDRSSACASSAARTPPSPGKAGRRLEARADTPSWARRERPRTGSPQALFQDFPGESGRTIRVARSNFPK